MTASSDTPRARTKNWGEPPHPDVIARLLAERYTVRPGEKLRVDLDEQDGSMCVHLWDARHRWRITVRWEAGGTPESPWMLIADALDALFGTFIESGRNVRVLPAGSGVEHQGVYFEVTAEHDLPEVSKLADQLLDRAT